MHVALESPDQPEVIALIGALDRYQDSLYPPEARYALDIGALSQPQVAFAVARDARGHAIGCAAVVQDGAMAELKRMYVRPDQRGQGVAGQLLAALEPWARQRGCRRLLLETGPLQPAAIAFYTRQGFRRRGPFAAYPDHPLSVFMEKSLAPADVELVRAQPGDAGDCIRLRGLTRENPIGAAQLAAWGITAPAWAARTAAGEVVGWLARVQGELQGHAFGEVATGEVLVLAVLPAAEGQGLGRVLLEHVVATLRASGPRDLFLGCSPDPQLRSHGFYRHLGWRPTGRRDAHGDEVLVLPADAPAGQPASAPPSPG